MISVFSEHFKCFLFSSNKKKLKNPTNFKVKINAIKLTKEKNLLAMLKMQIRRNVTFQTQI